MILILTQTFAPTLGGMEAYLTGLADQLASSGRETIVFADRAHKPFTPQTPYTLKRFRGWRPLRRWSKRRATAALAKTKNIDGIFCDSWKSVEALPENIAAPLAILAHGSEYPPEPTPPKRHRIAKALSRATSIIANSRHTADAVRAFLPTPNDSRLIVILPPIEPLPDPSPVAQKKIRALIGARHPVISTLARLEPRKGVDRVITALPQIIAQHPSVVFLIGGDGEDKKRLQDLAQKLGVADHIIFHGWVTDLDAKAALLSQSDVFAMPSYRVGTSVEGFGISYIEAAFFGVPSIGGKFCGASDAIIDGETGILCDGNDQAEVTAALVRILQDDETRQRLGRNAQCRIQTELIWEKALPRFLAALGFAAGLPS